jgi:hypothetical protein
MKESRKMDEKTLHDLRREPDPGFARALRERLRAVEDDAPARGFRFAPALATAAGIALVAFLFTVPAVRVAAQNALDLFRVHSFAPIEVDQARLDQLHALHDQLGQDPATMVLDQQEVLQEPGKPVDYPSADLAGNAAGLPGLKQPHGPLPNDMRFSKASVQGEGAARFTVRTEKLKKVIELLGLTDVRVPEQLDGQKVTVHMSPVVQQEYASDKSRMTLVEAHSPEVGLPAGTDLRQLGEIGLRILGLTADEARKVAGSIDWRSTLVVPVPTTAESFRQVHVNGHPGLFIRCEEPDASGKRHRTGAVVMWTEGDRVLAVQSNLPGDQLLDLAQTLR